MLQSRQSVLRRFWNPVVPSAQVSDKPVGLTYFNHPVVVWRDSKGVIHAQEDRCQHRTAKLSGGWISNDEKGEGLTCPYHGWRYGAGGACVHIPQQPELSARICAARARARAYFAEDRYGFVWVCLSPEPLAGILL